MIKLTNEPGPVWSLVIPVGWALCRCGTLVKKDAGPISRGPGRCLECGVLCTPLPSVPVVAEVQP